MRSSIQDIIKIRFGVYVAPKSDDNSSNLQRRQSNAAGQMSSKAENEVVYLQVRQFNETGELVSEPDEFLTVDDKNTAHLLKDGDVLFVGKGNRLFAWCYRESFGPAIASSIFFVLQPDQSKIYPEYLTAVLNAPQSKMVFQQIGAGTNIFSIRKSELGAFQIPVLPMGKQKQIVTLSEAFREDVRLTKKLIEQKENLYKTVLAKLIK